MHVIDYHLDPDIHLHLEVDLDLHLGLDQKELSLINYQSSLNNIYRGSTYKVVEVV